MSQADLDAVKTLFVAFAGRDLDAVARVLDPKVEIRPAIVGGPEGVVYRAGNSTFLVYPSAYAGTNKATAMSFQVPADTVGVEVAALRERDITFQTFDAEGITWDDGVASAGDVFRSVWFEDPDGNILNVETDNVQL